MKWLVFFLGVFSRQAVSQEAGETRELIGNLGGRAALIHLYATDQPGGFVRVAAEGCAELRGSQGYLEPVLVDRRGNCQLLRPRAR
mgnify:CR=1 FL=1